MDRKPLLGAFHFLYQLLKEKWDNLIELAGLASKKQANPDDSLSRVKPQARTNEAVLGQLKELNRSKKSDENPYLFT